MGGLAQGQPLLQSMVLKSIEEIMANGINEHLKNLSPSKQALFERLLREKQTQRPPAAKQAPVIQDSVAEVLPVPWSEPGWFEDAAAWLHIQAGQINATINGPIRQLRFSQDSCLLQLPTTAGNLYFKAVPTYYAHEPHLTAWLYQHFPAHMPGVVAVEPERHWLLMREISGRPLSFSPTPAIWLNTIRTWATIQLASREHRAALFDTGCFDRRVEQLPERFGRFAAADLSFLTALPGGLTPEELATVRALVPQIKILSQQIAVYTLPNTLDHGDFHPHNINIDDGNAIIFDWADGAIAHPFFSPATLMAYTTLTVPDMAHLHSPLRDTYLEMWRDYYPIATLRELFTAIAPLATCHYALNMFECVANWPSQPEKEMGAIREALTFCLRAILQHMHSDHEAGHA